MKLTVLELLTLTLVAAYVDTATTTITTTTITTNSCKIVEVRSYLKRVCEVEGEEYYQCPYSDTLYNFTSESCLKLVATNACENDPGFYQVCGHVTCSEYQFQESPPMLCGSYMCNETTDETDTYHDHNSTGSTITWGGYNVLYYLSCNNESDCSNTAIDEEPCPEDLTKCDYGSDTISSSTICNGQCDCYLCEDEAACPGQQVQLYGIVCNNTIGDRLGYPNWISPYIPPAMVCDGKRDCIDGRDEENCTSQITCSSSSYLQHSTVRLKPENSCTVPNELYLVCTNYRDQLNCSQNLDSPLICKVDEFETSVSEHGLCRTTSLCDNGIDKMCDAAEGGCVVHKHRFCDGREDCDTGMDEKHVHCDLLTNRRCERRLAYNRTSPTQPLIPLAWVMDGVEDCMDGMDENEAEWRPCGREWRVRYMELGEEEACTEVFICSPDQEEYIEYPNLCNRVSGCTKESLVCAESRERKHIPTSVTRYSDVVYIGHYLPGLDDLDRKIGNHVLTPFISPDKPFGVLPLDVSLVPGKIDCRYVFGELYVYLSCLGGCDNSTGVIPCILNKVKHDSCHNTVKNRVYTIADNSYLTIARRRKGQYISDLFSCSNGYCITYDKVCDLVDDCGDNSDEVACKNHFKCSDGEELIPLSSVADGTLDCQDFSDECLKSLGNSIIEDDVLSYSAWVIGILAIIFNMLALVGGVRKMPSLTSPVKSTNAALILVICFGDLLMGIYLVVIAVKDKTFGENYCATKYDWLTSGYCSALGVISTLGSQISLFSMTCLSIYRFFCITRSRSTPTNAAITKCLTALAISTIFVVSVAIAVVPLVPYFEDYFVNEVYYKGVPLFIGAPSKTKHIAILEKYHSKFRQTSNVKWSYIRKLVQEMFSADYDGVPGKQKHFYGNSGVCLFKFFITSDDPQQLFTMSVLLANFVCFVVICVCYASIYIHAQRSSERAGNKDADKRRGSSASAGKGAGRMGTLQRKIAAIIITDFLCWVPFIIVCVVHYIEIVPDYKPLMYSFFSIVILPINSVINPMLYDTTAVFGIWIEAYNLGRRVMSRYRDPRHGERVPGTLVMTQQTQQATTLPEIAATGPVIAGDIGPDIAGIGSDIAGTGPNNAGTRPDIAGTGPVIAGDIGPDIAGIGSDFAGIGSDFADIGSDNPATRPDIAGTMPDIADTGPGIAGTGTGIARLDTGISEEDEEC